MRSALARHDAIARAAVEANRGTVVKTTGDGVHATFNDPLDALAAVLQLQQMLADSEVTSGIPLSVRCGVHAGVDERRDDDFFGRAVNRAARIMGVAHGGQVLVSQAVASLVADRLPADVAVRDLGFVRLRDLATPERVYQLMHPRLRKDFPPLRSSEATPNNLPQRLSSFIGRGRELDEAKRLLEQTRLLTLVGAGGIGKTRLSLQLAAAVIDEYPDGVWFVDLAPMYDPDRVPLTVATTLGLREQLDRPIVETLCDRLSTRQTLLVLDNCEHLLAACAELVEQMLTAAPRLRVLATSREGLSVPGEQVVTVRSLAFAPPGSKPDAATLGAFAAIRLLVDRARLVAPDFTLDATTGPAVAEICRRLDGIPLAIELAAARVKVLSVDEIRSKLDDRFRLLTGGSKTALARHQTLHAAIQWSYDLLGPDEQRLLRQLAVFAGGWTLDAAVATAGDAADQYGVLDQLAHLVDKSLVTSQRVEHGATRYSMLETIRQYAQERLDASGEAGAARERHLRFFVALAEQAEPKLLGGEQKTWLTRLAPELENLLVALTWCDRSPDGAEQGLRLVAALRRFWLPFRLLELGLRVTIEALARPGSERETLVRARALHAASLFALYVGRFHDARRYSADSLTIARALGDAGMTAHALITLGTLDDELGDTASGLTRIEEALSLARSLGDMSGVSRALNALGEIRRGAGDFAAAEAFYEECLTVDRKQGDSHTIAFVLLNLARTFIPRGDVRRARPILLEAIDVALNAGSKWTLQASLDVTTGLAAATGDYPFAARMLGATEAELKALGYHRVRVDEHFLAPLAAHTREALTEAAYRVAHEGGYVLTIEQAVTEARAWLEKREGASAA